MKQFAPISSDDPIQAVIKQAFDMDLKVDGGWGYHQNNPIILYTNSLPSKQLQHTLASMRAHLEMSMTQTAEHRYGGINVSELHRETYADLEKVTYHVTAIPESDYAYFINAYKEGYGTEEFDMEAHFKARKKATLSREVTVWYRVKK
jgi:hypothetical protein